MSQEIPVHTLFLTVGPPRCGKSTFCSEYLKPYLESQRPQVRTHLISSERTRQRLLGQEYPRSHPLMNAVSRSAFKPMRKEMEVMMQFPINSHYLILDSSDLSPTFRQEMIDLTKKYHYQTVFLVFQYAKDDYSRYATSGEGPEIYRGVDRLFKQVLGNLGKGYLKALTIPSFDFESFLPSIPLNLDGLDLERRSLLDPTQRYLLIGDPHCCARDVQRLLEKAGFVIEDQIVKTTDKTLNCQVILLGDLIDKGKHPGELLEFVWRNLNTPGNLIHLIYGNHEDISFRVLSGTTKESTYSSEYYEKYFNSYPILRDDPALREKFFFVVSHMHDFLWYRSDDPGSHPFIASHAPCGPKVLGKVGPKVQKMQRDLHLNRKEPLIPQVRKMMTPDTANYPYHVCGHITVGRPYLGPLDPESRNHTLMLDTGCVYGNQLTGLWLGRGIERVHPKQLVVVRSSYETVDPSHQPMDLHHREVDPRQVQDTYQKLKSEDQHRLQDLIHNRISFLPGTISPPPANPATQTLESVTSALDYYRQQMSREQNFQPLVLQPKYMGSRGNLYLSFVDPSQNCLVSRSAQTLSRLSPVEKEKLYQQMYARLGEWAEKHQVAEVLIDFELMPWSGIGKGLIESEFRDTSRALKQELTMMQEMGFDQAWSRLVEVTPMKGKGKPPPASRVVRAMQGRLPTVAEQEEMRQQFENQVEWYGKEEEIHMKPFSFLRIVLKDGSLIIPGVEGYQDHELAMSQGEMFSLLNDEKTLVVQVETQEQYEMALMMAQEFFSQKQAEQMEGVVVKPQYLPTTYAPMMKVRNPEYLRIIYGWDYLLPERHEELVKKKQVWRKMRTSLKEWQLGLSMLVRPRESLTLDNSEHLHDLLVFRDLEEKAQSFDPAL